MEEKKKPASIPTKKGIKYYAMTTSIGIFYVKDDTYERIMQMKIDDGQSQYAMVKLTNVYPANPVSKGSPVKLENYAFPSSAVDISLNGVHGFYHLKEGMLTQEIEKAMQPDQKIIKLR